MNQELAALLKHVGQQLIEHADQLVEGEVPMCVCTYTLEAVGAVSALFANDNRGIHKGTS